eukprot:763303-Hanusia_phi.AAC.2
MSGARGRGAARAAPDGEGGKEGPNPAPANRGKGARGGRNRGGSGQGRGRGKPPQDPIEKQKQEEERERQRQEEAARKEAEELARKQEELERQRRQAEEERARRRKAISDLHERIIEVKQAQRAKNDARSANLNAANARLDVNLKLLDASIKKNEAIIKKLKMVTLENKDGIVSGIKQINMSKFISECVDAVSDSKMKSSDVPAMVQVVSVLHQRYADFTKQLIPKLSSIFLPVRKDSATADTESERKERLTKRRTMLRLLTELLVAGVYTDGSILVSALKDLIAQESQSQQLDAGATLFSIISGFVKYAADDLLNLRPQWQIEADAVLEEFQKRKAEKDAPQEGTAAAEETMEKASEEPAEPAEAMADSPEKEAGSTEPQGITPETAEVSVEAVATSMQSMQIADAEENENCGEDDDLLILLEEEVDSVEPIESPVISDEHREELFNILKEYYESTVSVLFEMHSSLKQQEKENRRQLTLRGDLPEDCMKATEKKRADLEKALSNTKTLSEALQIEMPELPKDPEDTTRLGGGAFVVGTQREREEENFEDNVFEDMDTRDFYEDLPNIFDLVPSLNSDVEASKAKNSNENADGGEESSNAGTDSTSAESAKESNEASTQPEAPSQEEEEKEDVNAVEKAKWEEFLAHLATCQSRDLIDQAAQTFCSQNNKLNRRKLARALYNVPRTSLSLIPYYARFVAVLSPAFPGVRDFLSVRQTHVWSDIGQMLAQMLEQEFNEFMKYKSESNIESKVPKLCKDMSAIDHSCFRFVTSAFKENS